MADVIRIFKTDLIQSRAMIAWAAAWLLAAAAKGEPAPRPLCPGCNVILVSLDTVRADALGIGGEKAPASPRLDALAARGLVFERAYSQAPFTLSSHFSIFTGLYPWHHGVEQTLRDRLPDAVPTLTQRLKAAGYRTVWFGPTRDTHLPLEGGLGKGFDEILPPPVSPWLHAGLWLERRDAGKPFFLFLHSYEAHDPYGAERASLLAVDPKGGASLPDVDDVRWWYDAGALLSAREELTGAPGRELERLAALSDPARRLQESRTLPLPHETRRRRGMELLRRLLPPGREAAALRAMYEGAIRDMDARLGWFFDELERLGLSGRTLVVITADHGEEFGEHGNWTHGYALYEESLRVPLVVLAPGLEPGRDGRLAQSVDIVPTILDALGLPSPDPLDGRSLLRPAAGPAYVFADWPPAGFAARDARFTYLRPAVAGAAPRLYDRVRDPRETVDVSAALPAEAARLREALAKQLSGRADGGRWPAWADEKARRRARRDGYW